MAEPTVAEGVFSLIFSIIIITYIILTYRNSKQIKNMQIEIKNVLGALLKDPKNIIVEDMKVVTSSLFGQNENKIWKIIGLISISINAIFILLLIIHIVRSF